MKNKEKIENLLIILLILLIVFLANKLSFIFKPILNIIAMFLGPIIISIFLYYWLRPITRFLSKGKLKKYKGIISAIVMILFFLVIMILVSVSGVKLATQFKDTIKSLTDGTYTKMIEESLGKINLDLTFFNKYKQEIINKLKDIANNIPSLFSSVGDFFTQLVLVPFMLYYLLKEEDKLDDKIYLLIPDSYKKEGKIYLKNIDKVLSTYIVGQLLVAFVIGVLMLIGYLIIGLPNAFLMSSISVITAVIPIIGTFLGILPALLIAITVDISMVLKVIIVSIIVQQLEGNVITPNLMGNRLNIHPFIIMIVVIISINLFGIFGAFIGIPLYLIIMISIKEYLKCKKLRLSSNKGK